MLCLSSLPGAAACRAWLSIHDQSRSALKHSCRAESHPKKFNYRPPPSPLHSPSLGRGWILKHDHDKPNSVLEVLLSKAEDEKEKELFQASRLRGRRTGEEEKLPPGQEDSVRMRAWGSDRRLEHQLEGSENDEGQLLPTKPKYVRGPDIDKNSFIRVYYLAALRVPVEESRDLAYELRKHLLNWPRVDNIGRFAGDDIDEDLANLFLCSSEQQATATADAVREAVYGKDNSNKLKEKRIKQQFYSNGVTRDKSTATTLELVSKEGESEQERQTEKWTGRTRLLLLDEKYAGRKASELSMDLQTVLSKLGQKGSETASGLVTCRLTLFYEYWSLDEVLRELLPAEAHKPVTFERTGHVAELKLQPEHLPFRHLIAQVTLDKYKPDMRSVVVKDEELCGKHYVVQLELLAGSSSLVTTAWEHGIPFRVDMASVVWDPRLSRERQRLVGMFCKHDLVCDVLAGVGLVAIPAGKKVRRVFANDVNSYAHTYLAQNVVGNGLTSTIEIFNDDLLSFLSKVFNVERPLPITQLVMSNPSAVMEFLDFFRGAFSRRTWPNPSLPQIHLYGISRAGDPERHFSKKIADVLQSSPHIVHTSRVMEVASGGWMCVMIWSSMSWDFMLSTAVENEPLRSEDLLDLVISDWLVPPASHDMHFQ